MHGRLKVRSSEEQEEAQRREKAEKVRVYRELSGKIYAKRSAGDLDDEALMLTRSMLSDNPDIGTLWNYRREILEAKIPTLSEDAATELCSRELSLLEYCLRVNPKSYGAWLHRQWVLEHTPRPDWKKEKALCNLFLNYDERNFHCWDYRRHVISKAGIPPQEEFDFTYEKIAANFSNYSAWHYRSSLLPKLHPLPNKEGGVTEEALLKEYELVQNAFFTDPSDQSAWLYHRWLLGKVDKPLALSCVLFKRTPKPLIYIVFNQPVKVTSSQPICVTVGETPVTSSVSSDWPEPLWECPIPDDVIGTADETTIMVKYDELEAPVVIKTDQQQAWWVGGVETMLFSSVLTAATSSVMQAELDSCRELLQLEPENKWCLLTLLLLMQALEPKRHHEEITLTFGKLAAIDPYRQSYYNDLLSRFRIEHTLSEVLQSFSDTSYSLDLSNKGLTRLYHTEHMLLFRTVSLSTNRLTSLQGIGQLKCIWRLELDGNQLEGLPGELAELVELRELSLRNNHIAEVSALECLRGSQLEVLNVEGNPVCELADTATRLVDMLPNLRELDSKLTKNHLSS